MADGNLVKMLLLTKIKNYLEWKCVDASYIDQHQSSGGMIRKKKEKLAVYKVQPNSSCSLVGTEMPPEQKINW